MFTHNTVCLLLTFCYLYISTIIINPAVSSVHTRAQSGCSHSGTLHFTSLLVHNTGNRPNKTIIIEIPAV